jgi:hypothetical protein
VIKDDMTRSGMSYSLVKSIKKLLEMEANQCTDVLADIDCEMDCNIEYFDVRPSQIRHLFAVDSLEKSISRLIIL